jgi:hypothetical protein
MFLEVPVQDKEVPKEILDYATSKDIYIHIKRGWLNGYQLFQVLELG